MLEIILNLFENWRQSHKSNLKLKKSVDKLTNQIEKQNSPWWNLYLGIMNGFGVFIGGVIIVAIFIFILSKLNTVPVIGDYISKIVQIVERKRN